MGRTCKTHMVMMNTKFQSEDQKGTHNLPSLGTAGTVAIRRVLKKQNKGAQERVQWLGLVNSMELSAMWHHITW